MIKERKIVKNNLKKLRKKSGVTINDIIKGGGVKYSQEYYNFESGKINYPRTDKAIKIAKVLGVKVEDIWVVK